MDNHTLLKPHLVGNGISPVREIFVVLRVLLHLTENGITHIVVTRVFGHESGVTINFVRPIVAECHPFESLCHSIICLLITI